MNKENCLICAAPLEYLLKDEGMECAVCHQEEMSRTRCVNGHYVCNACHMQGMDAIFGLCLAETSWRSGRRSILPLSIWAFRWSGRSLCAQGAISTRSVCGSNALSSEVQNEKGRICLRS